MSDDIHLRQVTSFATLRDHQELREDHDHTKKQLAEYDNIIKMLLQRIDDPVDSRSVGSSSSKQNHPASPSGVNNDGCSLGGEALPYFDTINTSVGKLDILISIFQIFL